MPLVNSKTAYGWIAIALHWISVVGVVTLYFLGERMEDAPDRTAELAARSVHVSVGVLLFTFLVARLFWSASQPEPAPLEQNRWLRLAAKLVQILFLLMIAVLIVTGPLSEWSAPRPLDVFGLFAIPSPFPARVEWLHDFAGWVHANATQLFWPLIALHVAGALKHLVINRDGTLQRMLWVRRS
jgi:cytochrome b561